MIKVLLVDDHALVRAGTARLLQMEADLTVVGECADAESAWRELLAAPSRADVVVLDLSLPGRSGLDLLRQVSQRWPDLPVLVCTMHDSAPMLAQAMALGARGFVTKASDPLLLADAVRRVARGETVLSPDVQALRDHAAARAPHAALSPREFEVLLMLARGHAVDAIAEALHLSPKRVANLQTAVRTKLGFGNAVELVHYAREHGLIDS
jgi:DNA-binding NarL/FixJ family response regulator